ncbi:MAG: hypothetical protein NVS3B17_02450 [Vulcanimicrobiaceae bacterium]
MTSTFARRLWLVTSLEVGAAFLVLVVAGALFALGAYVGTLRAEFTTTLDRMVAALDSVPATHDARIAGRIVASRYPRSAVSVLLIDSDRRVVVYQPAARRPAVVDVRRRGDTGADVRARTPFDRLVLGLVTAFGLTVERAHVGTIDVIVRPNEPYLAAAVGHFVPWFVLVLACASALAIAFARVLTLQALRPLLEVELALERFAAGDLAPHPVATDRRHQLGSLARAYNGAIAQMEHAFAERDRANFAMRQFIADAGHQLRTPLTVIRGFIAVLRKGVRTPADADRILETMNRQSLLMGSLIEKLMLLDRWEDDAAPAFGEPIDLARLATDAIAPLIEAHPARAMHIEAAMPALAAIDPIDFTHALGNIVDNAIKYTTGAIALSVDSAESEVTVVVADDGPGMSTEEAGHAFDRFYRGARRDVEGSGLGLSIARRAVERAGGTLDLESSRDGGSRFTIRLPVYGGPVP